jgi:hypothetical protein
VGTQLDIYRDGSPYQEGCYLGKLVIKAVAPKEAAAEFKSARRVPVEKLRQDELPRKGDTVSRLSIAQTVPSVEVKP